MAAENLLYDGAVIHSVEQTKGRGQRGNQWITKAGKNLTFTVFAKPNFLSAGQQFELNRIVSISIAEILEELLFINEVSIKWPNDIYIGDEKIAGILIENTLSGAAINKSIIGIGLNVNQNEGFPSRATSMAMCSGKVFDILYVLEQLVSRLEKYYFLLKSNKTTEIYKNYAKRLYKKGISADYKDKEGTFKGIIQDVDKDGTLLIYDVQGYSKKYQFKEVQFL